jgi:ubiquinone/menaquinone biosynthesis C-methylase UbiE
VRPGDLVLDFACGTGLNIPGLVRAGAGEIVGIDVSAAMLARASRRFPAVRFVRADLATVDLGIRAPRVLCTYGLSLVAEPEEAAANLLRHVQPRGQLVLLDFDGPTGPFGLLRGTWAAWLRAFGVRPPWSRLLRLRPDRRRRLAGGFAAILDCGPESLFPT